MAKRKGRAARKQQREKAVKAEEHGLPAPALAPKPQKTRKVGGDTVAAAVASEKAGRAGPRRRVAPPPETGVPMAVKVLAGAVVALLIVFALSQFRKSGSVASPAHSESFRAAQEQSIAPSSTTEETGAIASDITPPMPEDVISDGATPTHPKEDEEAASLGAAPLPEPRAPARTLAPSTGSAPAVARVPEPSAVPLVPVPVAPPSAAPAPVAPAPSAPAPVTPAPVAPAPGTSPPAE